MGTVEGCLCSQELDMTWSDIPSDVVVMGGCTLEVTPSLMVASRQLLLSEQPCGDQSAHLVQVSCLNVCRLFVGPLSSKKRT